MAVQDPSFAVEIVDCFIAWYDRRRQRREKAASEAAKQEREAKARAAIAALPLAQWSAPAFPDVDMCAVCLESFVDGDELRRLPCCHLYHRACIDAWLVEQQSGSATRTCPSCKCDVLTKGPNIIAPAASLGSPPRSPASVMISLCQPVTNPTPSSRSLVGDV